VQITVQLAHWAFTANHTRHYAAMESHPPGGPKTERRLDACLSRVLPLAAVGSQRSYDGCATLRA